MIIKIKNKYCISSQDGEQLFNLIYNSLIQDYLVELNFENVYIISSVFINCSISRLLETFKVDTLNKRLIISNLNEINKRIFKNVINNAIKYYSDINYRTMVDKIMSEKEFD